MSKELPILQQCDHRRELGGQLFCVHWNKGDRSSDEATPIEAKDCERCIVKDWLNQRPRKEPTKATIPQPYVPRPQVPQHGPGTELTKIFAEANCKEPTGCSCKADALWMNSLGVEGCRERIDEVVSRLGKNAKLMGVFDWMKCGKGLASLGIFSLRQAVEEAIRRADTPA